MELHDIKTINSLLRRHGFSFSRSLGQNFLIDPYICPKMADLSGVGADSGVIEIGTGIGVLTKELALRAAKVVSFEADRRLLPVLSETMDGLLNVKIINADFLKCDLAALLEELGGMDLYVCANLPYYITSPVIMKLVESRLFSKSMTFMVQKEAAERFTAEVGSREAGAVTVAVNYFARVTSLFPVSKDAFLPSPKVDSKVIRFDIREKPEFTPLNEGFFFKTVKSLFAQRRKTAANALSAGLKLPKTDMETVLRTIGKPANVRGETLTMEELVRLSDGIYGLTI